MPLLLGPPYMNSSQVESSKLQNSLPNSGGPYALLLALHVYFQPSDAEETEKQTEHTGS